MAVLLQILVMVNNR